MPEKTDKVVPEKCTRCNKPMSTPLACDYCHALFPQAATANDYFQMLSVPRQFDLDEKLLHDKFLALNRHAHPDFHANETPEVQQLSLQISAAVNDAYRTLTDPLQRGAYLLQLLGGKTSAEDKSVPDGFLPTMMMMQEEIEDAKSGNEPRQLDSIRVTLQNQHDGLLKRISNLFKDLEPASACQVVMEDYLGEIRKNLNAVSYVRKLLSQV